MSSQTWERESNWWFLASYVYRGLSVNRALLHLQARDKVVLKGNVLDVGGGHRQTYLEYLDVGQTEDVTSLDIRTGAAVNIRGSVTQMPVKSVSIDTVLCFNLLEHVYDHREALSEVHRVLKPGAMLYGWTPFAFGVHGAPFDFWRYTPEAVRSLLNDAGFSPIEVRACGGTFLAAFDMIRPYIRGWLVGRLTRGCGVIVALLVTRLFAQIEEKLTGRQTLSSCPNGVWFAARRD